MHQASNRGLALVANRPEPDHDPNEAHPAPAVADRPEAIVRQRRLGAAGATHPTSPALGTMPPTDRLPFVVRLTMAQILEVAEDAEIRAEILDGVTSTLDAERDATFIRRAARSDQIERRVDSLREVAGDLRGIAAQMMDRWAGPERSS